LETPGRGEWLWCRQSWKDESKHHV
jgi:hypothetical protein